MLLMFAFSIAFHKMLLSFHTAAIQRNLLLRALRDLFAIRTSIANVQSGCDQAAADQGSRAGLYTLFQHAPELQRAQSAFTSKGDVWALGAMILHEMLYCCCGQLCVPGSAARTCNNTASPLAHRSNPLWTKSGVPFDPSYACISKALQIMYSRATADGCTPDDGETKLYEHLCNMNTRL